LEKEKGVKKRAVRQRFYLFRTPHASFFYEKERGAKKPLKGIRGGLFRQEQA
jgi:hypothetical protein